MNVITYLLTPWCRVLLEKLTDLQLVKKFPAFLWNSKVHYRTHKRPPPVPVLGQPNPVHIPISHLLEIHPNIIHPSMPRSPQWSLSLRFPHQDPIRPPLWRLLACWNTVMRWVSCRTTADMVVRRLTYRTTTGNMAGVHKFSKNGNYLKILGARRTTQSKFHTKKPQILGATIQNSVAMATWYLRFVHPWL